jgi:hypothetical protein
MLLLIMSQTFPGLNKYFISGTFNSICSIVTKNLLVFNLFKIIFGWLSISTEYEALNGPIVL